jgi:hypothetical protein
MRSSTKQKRGALSKTPRFSPTEEVNDFYTPPPLAGNRAQPPRSIAAPPKIRRGWQYAADNVLS